MKTTPNYEETSYAGFEPTNSIGCASPVDVVIKDIRMKPRAMISLMVQIALCSIPAAVILIAIALFLWLGVLDMLKG